MPSKSELVKSLRDLRPVDSLILLPDNPRHGDVGAISQSLERFGQQKPIVINPDGVILAGNHTFQAAVALGWTDIWVYESDLEGVDQPGFALADNRLSDLATYDHDALLRFLETQDDLIGTGYDEQDMAQIANDLTFEKQGYDGQIREPPKEPLTKLGDVWLLDGHTLHCADAFKVELAEHACLLTDDSNILQFARENEKLHTAAKPVPLLEQLIKNSTMPGDTVLDLFAGSGSTLIAAANTERTCTLVEIDPGWCDVIIDRYRDVYPDADIRKA